MTPKTFQKKILQWFDVFGRKDLPWQTNPTPYRVWVSEIMLQQTQVTTVLSYFERFMKRFDSIESLSKAKLDSVLSLWTGLGYYARARNLHKSAHIIRKNFNNEFPKNFEDVVSLPGIGKSTAGAILSISQNQRYPILDGNVKRVLCRYYGIEGWPDAPKVQQQLWQLADQLTPQVRVKDYAQAMMDLGATVCTRTRPNCLVCPLKTDCFSKKTDQVLKFPFKKPNVKKPIKSTIMLILRDKTRVLLEKRPLKGIWGGLYCLPEISNMSDLPYYTRGSYETWQAFRHTFTHFHLDIQPIYINVNSAAIDLKFLKTCQWLNIKSVSLKGLPAPVVKLLSLLEDEVKII